MPIQAPDEFAGFCLGLDVALTRNRAKAATPKGEQQRLDAAIRESLSYFELPGLEKLQAFISAALERQNAAAEVENLWLGLKPNKVFFGRSKIGDRDPAYIFIFKRVQQLLVEEIALQRKQGSPRSSLSDP